MIKGTAENPLSFLLVEDNPGDVEDNPGDARLT